MPIYEYRCESCAKVFERFVQGRETPECPKCGTTGARRLLSGFSVGAAEPKPAAGPGACGSCGDPRGPGACALE